MPSGPPPALRPKTLAAALCLGALLTACGQRPAEEAAPAPAAGDGPPRLLVLSSTIGYVEPCGCTIDLTLGGIDRVAALVAAEREAGPTAVVVVGPHLFEHAPPPHKVAQEEAKARLIARSLAHIGVDAVVPTATELVRGEALYAEVRRTFAAPDVTANVPRGRGRIVTLGDLKLGVFGLAAPEAAVPGGQPADPKPAAIAEAERLRQAGAHVVVALGAMPRRQIRRMARETPGIDLWVLGDHPEEAALASPLKHGYLIEAGDRGRNLGRVVFHEAAQPGPLVDPVGDAERARKALDLQIEMRSDLFQRTGDAALEPQIAELKAQRAALAAPEAQGRRFVYTLLPVAKAVTPDPEVAGWLAAYNASLKTINLAQAGEIPKVPPGMSGYAGDDQCADCHYEAHTLWTTTRHGEAWQTLVEADKTFDAECVGCHVTGWQKPGGSVLGQTEGRVNVQCEVCHGPGAQHVDSGGDPAKIERAVPEAVCVECHNKHHSPQFDYAGYLPKILGPGHQRRAQ